MVEQCFSIDAAKWMRQGILREGAACSGWQWVLIHYEVNTADVAGPRVQLTYDRSGQHLDYSVSLETTQPQFGGLRWWFQCPVCRRRVQKLFLPPRTPRFGCRQCYKLSYTSRNESPHERTMERARAIRLRLGGTPSLPDPFPGKPKGMRWKRYQRLQDQYEHYNNASLNASLQFLMERLHLEPAKS